MAKNDFAAYGVAQKALADAVKKAIAAQAEIAATCQGFDGDADSRGDCGHGHPATATG